MNRMFILLAAMLLSPLLTEKAFAVIEVRPVTKETQAKEDLDFTLAAVEEAGSVWVDLQAPKNGKLATLSLVQLEVKDAKGKELLLAPLAVTNKKGTISAHFRMALDQAEHSNIVLVTEQSKPKELPFAINYSISLKSYIIGRARRSRASKPRSEARSNSRWESAILSP